MKKYINIENTGNLIARVLSITDTSISPNGLEYIEIDNYIDPPELINPALDVAYPMYNKSTQIFYWVVVNYQMTATEVNLQLENTKYQLQEAQIKINELTQLTNEAKDMIALLLETQADILGGAI